MHQYIEKYSFSIFIYLFGKLVCISSDTTNARFDLNWYVTQMQCATSRLRNDLYCVEWGVKLYSLTPRYV